jgi:hypothetical protein
MMRLIALAALALLGACVPTSFYTRPIPLDVQADQFNVAAARAERLMVVRNVMRGRDRTSMLYTRIATFTGSMQSTVSATTGASIGEGGGNDTIAPGLTLGGQVSPSFNLTILNDQKFHRAIGSRMDLGLYEALLAAGWPPNLLHSLFVARVVENGRTVHRNDPFDAVAFADFQNWLTPANGHTLQMCSKSNPHTLGPAVTGGGNLQGYAALAEQELEYNRVEGAWRVQQPNTDRWLDFDCSSEAPPSILGAQFGADQMGPVEARGTSADGIYLRSIQGALYYLGEIVRAQGPEGAPIVRIRVTDSRGRTDEQPLFVVQRAGRAPASGLVFQHEDGITYYVPPSNPAALGRDLDRTNQVITLMLQLIGLIQEREDLPGPPSVRIVP